MQMRKINLYESSLKSHSLWVTLCILKDFIIEGRPNSAFNYIILKQSLKESYPLWGHPVQKQDEGGYVQRIIIGCYELRFLGVHAPNGCCTLERNKCLAPP